MNWCVVRSDSVHLFIFYGFSQRGKKRKKLTVGAEVEFEFTAACVCLEEEWSSSERRQICLLDLNICWTLLARSLSAKLSFKANLPSFCSVTKGVSAFPEQDVEPCSPETFSVWISDRKKKNNDYTQICLRWFWIHSETTLRWCVWKLHAGNLTSDKNLHNKNAWPMNSSEILKLRQSKTLVRKSRETNAAPLRHGSNSF